MKNSGATAVSAKPPSAQKAATRSPGFTGAPSGALSTIAPDLAAGHERQRRFHLVLAARLQQLGERHARGVHLHQDARAGRQHVRGLGLGRARRAQARCRGRSPRRSGSLSSWDYLRNIEERVHAMATCLCVLYDDPSTAIRRRYARDGVPTIERYHDGQSAPTPAGARLHAGRAVGCVSGELGLREFLEGRGHTLVVTSDKDGPTRCSSASCPTRRSSSPSRSGPPT